MGLLKYKTIGQVRGALLRLGFEDVRETSEGAAFVTAEYAKLLAEHKMENIITLSLIHILLIYRDIGSMSRPHMT